MISWGAVSPEAFLPFAGTTFLPEPLENFDWVDNQLRRGIDAGLRELIGFALWWATTIAAVVSIVVASAARGDRARAAQVAHDRAALLVVAFVVAFSLSS